MVTNGTNGTGNRLGPVLEYTARAKECPFKWHYAMDTVNAKTFPFALCIKVECKENYNVQSDDYW